MRVKVKHIIFLVGIIGTLISFGIYTNGADAKAAVLAAVIDASNTVQSETASNTDVNLADQEVAADLGETTDQGETTAGTTDQGDGTDQDGSAETGGPEEPGTTDGQDGTTEDGENQEYTGKIILKNKKISINQGKTYPLEVELTEENLTGEEVKFESSNKKIVTVSAKGIIKAVHWGTATVTVSLGDVKSTCKVTVTKDISITISAAGDVTLSSDIKQPASINFFSVYNKQKNNSYFFKNVKSIFDKDDMTIVNFEGTLSSRGERVDKQWAFRGKPSYIDILNQGSIEAVAFANNHVRDYGEISYKDTISCFKKADIVYSSFSDIGVYEVKGIKIGMISILETGTNDDVTILRTALKKIKKEAPDLLIVSFHWGIEKTSTITKSQHDLSRIAIDEGGADLVLGHHPHVLQPIEKYKDAYIVYSLGNFCFGGNTNPPDKDTMIYQQTFTFHNDELVPDDSVKIIPCSVSSISSRNNYQPTPSEDSEKKRILKKINGYCKQFGISFDSNGKIALK
jgi:poly-gamma-glutamate synthesis protein (capsule biosynthesis protein)